MGKPSTEMRECEELLAAIVAERPRAMEALSDWIQNQPGYDFSRTRTLGELMADGRFASALHDVEPFKQLLDLGCPQNHVQTAAVDEVVALLKAANSEDAARRAKTILDFAAKTPAKQREWRTATFICLPYVRSVPPRYDALLADVCRVHREADQEKTLLGAFARIPVDRRDAILAVAIERGAWEAWRISKALLALASKALRARVAKREDQAKKAASAAAAKEKALKKAAPFRFVDPVRVLPSDYASLDTAGKAQYLAAARGYVDSDRVKNPSDFIRQLKKEGLGEGDAEMRRWTVMRGKEHVYDLWVVWVDNAAFFVAGTEEQIPVYVTQGSYLPRDEKSATKKLAMDLSHSEPESLWSLNHGVQGPSSKP